MVVENVDERHLKKAMWLFPLVPPAHQHLRAADRVRRAADVPAGRRRRRHLRAHDADEGTAAAARADRLHRRPFGRDRHDHRRNGRARHHGVQRPRHAAAPARRPPASLGAPRPRRHPADDPPRHHHPRRAARLRLCAPDRRILRAGDDRPRLVRGGDAVRAGDHRRHLLERRHQGGRGRRADRRIPGVDLHAAAAVFRAVGLDRPELRRERSAGPRRCSSRTRCSGSRGSTRSRMPRSGRCW